MVENVLRVVVGAVGLFVAVFVVLFLGGLCSAALEIRRERRAGVEPTRPAWENRDKRRALGGFGQQVRAAWANARSPLSMCWCGFGPLQEFPALDASNPAGLGCVAVEAGHQEAFRVHAKAGGYARVPVA